MMRRYRRPVTRGKRILYLILAVFVGMMALFLFIDSRMRPVIKQMAEAQATGYCNLIIEKAVTDAMSRSGVNYSDLVTVQQGSGDSPGVLSANIAAINLLKTQLTAEVQKYMDDYTESTVGIKIGTLMGTDFLADRGPTVNIKIIPVSNVNASISNQFESAGINQTLHRIMMQIVVDISIVLPGYSTTTTVVTDFCIAETVIIGAVPQSYFEIIPKS